jgi:hypothetical protein
MLSLLLFRGSMETQALEPYRVIEDAKGTWAVSYFETVGRWHEKRDIVSGLTLEQAWKVAEELNRLERIGRHG